MTDHQLEQRLGDWYAALVDPAEPAPQALRAELVAIPDVSPRARPTFGRWAVLLAAAALAVGLLAAGIAIGMRIVQVPTLPPPSAPAVVPSESPEPSEPAAPEVASRDVVAFSVATRLPEPQCRGMGILRCTTTRIWVANTDGSNGHELLADWPGRQELVGWTSNGDALYFISTSRDQYPAVTALWATDSDGRELRLIDADDLCPEGCGDLSISPDGSRLTWARYSENESVIAILETDTGEVREIDATRVGAFPESVAQPRWSPDGETLVYVRSAFANNERCFRPEAGALMTMLADGSELREIVPLETCAWGARWSPDGTSLVFYSDAQFITEEIDGRYAHELHDVYTVRADGSDFRRLTTDQISSHASWTTDGRIVFARIPLDDGSTEGLNMPLGHELWIMDPDGANPRQLDADNLGELSAVGCQACPYPPPRSDSIFGTVIALWQPAAR